MNLCKTNHHVFVFNQMLVIINSMNEPDRRRKVYMINAYIYLIGGKTNQNKCCFFLLPIIGWQRATNGLTWHKERSRRRDRNIPFSTDKCMCSERQVPTLIQRFFCTTRHVLNVGDWTLCVPLPNVVWMFNFIAHPGWTNSNPKKIPTSDFDCFDLVRFWARYFWKKYKKIHGGLFLKPFFSKIDAKMLSQIIGFRKFVQNMVCLVSNWREW